MNEKAVTPVRAHKAGLCLSIVEHLNRLGGVKADVRDSEGRIDVSVDDTHKFIISIVNEA